MDNKVNDKMDLLNFQKNLNNQFLEILKDKNNPQSDSLIEIAKLGLTENIVGLNFFLPLKDLKNISNDNRFESLPLTKSWIIGFNQVRGDIFTIIDLEKIINIILYNKETNNKKIITNNSNILYLKDTSNNKLGLVIDSLKMENVNTHTPLVQYLYDKFNDSYVLKLEDKLEDVIKEEKCSAEELELLKYIKESYSNQKIFSQNDIMENIDKGTEYVKLFWIMIDSIYIDSNNKLILVINFQKLSKFLTTISSF